MDEMLLLGHRLIKINSAAEFLVDKDAKLRSSKVTRGIHFSIQVTNEFLYHGIEKVGISAYVNATIRIH